MPVFDERAQRIVVQVVYDGPAYAGKTTNLKQLCSFFSLQRRSQLFSAQSMGDRTLFLDWLELEAGVVAGRRLRCQMLTVPGQTVLARRRWHLLRRADAVVFVVESTPAGLDEGRRMFEAVRRFASELGRELPLIVQANKQDKLGALGPDSVAHELGLTPERVVVARADAGVGVRETTVLAIRAVADVVQRHVLQQGLGSLSGRSYSGAEIKQQMEADEARDPRSPMDIVLQNSSPGLGLALEGLAALVERKPASAALDPPASPREAGTGVQAAPRSTAVSRPGSRQANSLGASKRGPPPLPEAQVPSGLIWPSATGRDLLRRVPLREAEWREEFQGQLAAQEGRGRSDTVIVEAGLWCLKTSPRRCFENSDRARDALLLMARRKVALGSLLAKNTVLTLQPDEHGAYWLWTVSPWFTTLRARMNYCKAHHELGELRAALLAFARAVLKSLKLAQHSAIQLDIRPSNFVSVGAHIYYLDDDILEGSSVPTVGHSLLRRVEEFVEFPELVDAYVTCLVTGLREEFDERELRRLCLKDALSSSIVSTAAGQVARQRLLAALP